MCQENKQGASKKRGIRRLQATVAGSVTTDRGSNIKWKKIRCAEGFLQEEEMHLDTFVGTQGYETPLDWAFDIYRGSGPCSASDRLASIVVFWWKSQRFCVPRTPHIQPVFWWEKARKAVEFNLQAPSSCLRNWINGRDFYGPVHSLPFVPW